MERMKISIIIPSFNQGKVLSGCLDSVISQTYSNKEVVIVDGGSTDETGDVVKRYAGHISKYVSEPDRGMSDAVNKGIGYATGDYLYFLSCDDRLYDKAESSIFTDQQLLQYYKSISHWSDWVWGKSRSYLMPFWSTKYTATKITQDIYISDLPSAFNRERLHDEGITHIVNMIIGVDSLFPEEFEYLNIPSHDNPSQDLSQYFQETNNFIQNAINHGGKVLVHCSQGISRSSTIIIAYLITQGYSYLDALLLLQDKRPIVNTNLGFRQQLLNFEAKFTLLN